MYDLYYWPTPNGHKITMFMEETGLDYNIVPVDIGKGEQFEPDFLKIAPNNRMPALVDHQPEAGGDPISLFESGAILLYLADKHRKFIAQDDAGRADVLQWLFWQMGNLGPMCGQNHHFVVYCEEAHEYAMDRYVNETSRLYAVLDRQLTDREFICGNYSIADMASYPWIVPHKRQKQTIDDFPNLKRWFDSIRWREATLKAYDIGKEVNPNVGKGMSEEEKKILFGQDASSLRQHFKD